MSAKTAIRSDSDRGCPYNGLAEKAFFRNDVLRGGSLALEADLDLALTPDTRVVSAGSCFAARIATYIRSSGVTYLTCDDRIATDGETIREEAPALFSLRYGNIYTARHLLQLLQRATGQLRVEAPVARDGKGRYRNLLRPSVLSYASTDVLRADDQAHLANVKALLGQADVFIFTLGLTEHWVDTSCDLVLPTTPGCGHGDFDPARHHFRNASLSDVVDELQQTFALLAQINSRLKVLLTLSPVPLVATYTAASAVEATIYSKSLLRQAIALAVAGSPERKVGYFPSYEIITNPHVIRENFAADMRSISETGVSRVMAHFRARYLGQVADETAETAETATLSITMPQSDAPIAAVQVDPVCDEENIWQTYLNRKGASQ